MYQFFWETTYYDNIIDCLFFCSTMPCSCQNTRGAMYMLVLSALVLHFVCIVIMMCGLFCLYSYTDQRTSRSAGACNEVWQSETSSPHSTQRRW